MFDVGVVSALGIWVVGVAWRALWGAAPGHPVRFAVVAAVSAAIHLGFHAAATASPSIATAVAFVLAGWSTFGLWCMWLGRGPTVGFRSGEEDDGSTGEDGGGGGGGGGHGPHDGPPGGGDDPDDDDGGFDWDAFEREFAAYAEQARLEPAND
jgi:hypothetical protein